MELIDERVLIIHTVQWARTDLSEDCKKLSVPGRLDKSVDGLDESGCGASWHECSQDKM